MVTISNPAETLQTDPCAYQPLHAVRSVLCPFRVPKLCRTTMLELLSATNAARAVMRAAGDVVVGKTVHPILDVLVPCC